MAFEQVPPPPTPPTPPSNRPTPRVSRSFDPAAFYGIIFGLLLLGAILFLFRNQIAAKIAEWRGTGTVVSVVVPTPPKISPAPTTPTPTATAVPTPTPTPTIAKATPVATHASGSIPNTGPEDSLLLIGGLSGASLVFGRSLLYRRRLKNRLRKLDIF